MTWVKPQVTIRNATIDGQTVDGTFVFPTDVVVESEVRTQEFFQSDGTLPVVASVVLDMIDEQSGTDLGEGIRKELSFDVGGGIHAITIDFTNFTGSDYQWGDTGAGGTTTDATGEDVHAQMSVLDRYLNAARIDSTNPAILEVTEFSTEGRYSPLKVVPENPNMVFNSTEQSSIFDSSITWVETMDLNQAIDGAKRTEG